MSTALKNFVYGICLISLVLVCVRFIASERYSAESLATETTSATVPDSSDKSFPRPRALRTFPDRKPADESASTAPLKLPEDPDQLREWARENLDAALSWLRNAPAGETRDTVVEIVCARVAESNPAEAVSLAERYAGGCSNLLENMVHQWADQNEPAARAYARNKPRGDERDRLLSRVALARSKENPHDAAQLVAEWIVPGDVQSEAAISVLHQWATRDATAALAWAESFADQTLRNRALTELTNIFASQKQ